VLDAVKAVSKVSFGATNATEEEHQVLFKSKVFLNLKMTKSSKSVRGLGVRTKTYEIELELMAMTPGNAAAKEVCEQQLRDYQEQHLSFDPMFPGTPERRQLTKQKSWRLTTKFPGVKYSPPNMKADIVESVLVPIGEPEAAGGVKGSGGTGHKGGKGAGVGRKGGGGKGGGKGGKGNYQPNPTAQGCHCRVCKIDLTFPADSALAATHVRGKRHTQALAAAGSEVAQGAATVVQGNAGSTGGGAGGGADGGNKGGGYKAGKGKGSSGSMLGGGGGGGAGAGKKGGRGKAGKGCGGGGGGGGGGGCSSGSPPQTMDDEQQNDVSTEVCKNYLAGKCRLGASCRRIHKGNVEQTPIEKIDEVCNNFLEGKCPFGENCRRKHEKPVAPVADAAAARKDAYKTLTTLTTTNTAKYVVGARAALQNQEVNGWYVHEVIPDNGVSGKGHVCIGPLPPRRCGEGLLN
jgi:hypothetical protein